MSNTTQTLDSAPSPPSWAERQAALRVRASNPETATAHSLITRLLRANSAGPAELGVEIARVHQDCVDELQSLVWYIEDLKEQIREANDPTQWTARAERVSQLIAHRAVHSAEHDPAHGMIHGYCAVCGIPWPCEIAVPKS